MALTVPLSPQVQQRLAAKAEAAGLDVTSYAAALLERNAEAPITIAEISGPVAEDFAKTGMTEAEFVDLLEDVKHEMRVEKRTRRGS